MNLKSPKQSIEQIDLLLRLNSDQSAAEDNADNEPLDFLISPVNQVAQKDSGFGLPLTPHSQ